MKIDRSQSTFAVLLILFLMSACSPYHNRMVRVKSTDHKLEKKESSYFQGRVPIANKRSDASISTERSRMPEILAKRSKIPASRVENVPSRVLGESVLMYEEVKVQPQDSVTAAEMIAVREVHRANVWAWVSFGAFLLTFPFIFPIIFAVIASGQAMKRYKTYYVEGMPQYYWVAKIVRIVSLVLLGLLLVYFLGLIIFLALFW